MDKKRRKVAVFHNLPEGGGMRMLGSILNRYKKTHSIDLFVIAETLPVKVSGIKANFVKVKPWRGFLFRNLWILFKLPKIHRDLSKIINSNCYARLFHKVTIFIEVFNNNNNLFVSRTTKRILRTTRNPRSRLKRKTSKHIKVSNKNRR